MSGDDRKRRRAEGGGEDEPDAKKAKGTPPPAAVPDQKQVAAMLAEKQRQIRESLERLKKEKGLAISSPGTPPAVKPATPPVQPVAIVNEEIQRKIEEARALLAERKAREEAEKAMQEAQGEPPEVDKTKRGLNFEFDMKSLTSAAKRSFATTKANQRVIAQQFSKEKKGGDKPASETDPNKNPYLNTTPPVGGRVPGERVARKLKFNQPGKYIAQATQLRTKAQLEKLKQEIAESVKKTGMEAEMDLVSDQSVRREAPPEIEWWDAQFAPDKSYDNFNPELYAGQNQVINNLVQHPIQIEPPAEPGDPKPRPLMLTKKERKKLRRQRRQEALKEKQDKIRLGLLPPDQAKVKISNLMLVLGKEAVQDPTKIEAQVKAQVAARLKKHKDTNAANRLTEEQRKEKIRRKLHEDTSKLVQVAVFKIDDLSHPQHKFKVDKNATQHELTGVAIVYSGMNLVIVEGGPKGIKFYKNLMTRRIDWSGERNEDEEDAGPSDKKRNECIMVWEGDVKERRFKGFKFRAMPTEAKAKEFLEKFGAVHYWDAARNWVSEVS
ncbi:U4/U6 small nuclear ribonucleoprotein Prp3 [Rhizophlyctis rosea]|nr:U4/U6 small nuclear ribonucleoprotein Prp3 [Rhizophlyctis rosea]